MPPVLRQPAAYVSNPEPSPQMLQGDQTETEGHPPQTANEAARYSQQELAQPFALPLLLVSPQLIPW